MADVCEASVSSVYSVDCPKLVFIRVNSWFLKNDLRVGHSKKTVTGFHAAMRGMVTVRLSFAAS